MFETFFGLFTRLGFTDATAVWMARYSAVLLVLLLSILAYYIAKRFLLILLAKTIQRTTTQWDDKLLQRKVFQRLAYLAPAVVIYLMAPTALQGYLFENWGAIITRGVTIYIIALSVFIVDGVLNAILDIYREFEHTKDLPLKGLVQVIKLGLYFMGGLLAISTILGQTPVYLLGSLGALAAVLSFIYQDALRGLVAGIQLTATSMLARDDFIEMPSFDVSGVVTEIGLTTIKVQNSDFTVTTVPTYALISASFKNWRGLADADGRRILRAMNFDLHSIQCCNVEMLDRFQKIPLIKDWVEEQRATAEIEEMTNFSVFTTYAKFYLQNHPMINQELTLLVRQLEPTAQGLPLQIFAYCKETELIAFEEVQGEIFNHLLATADKFDLQLYQNPVELKFKR